MSYIYTLYLDYISLLSPSSPLPLSPPTKSPSIFLSYFIFVYNLQNLSASYKNMQRDYPLEHGQPTRSHTLEEHRLSFFQQPLITHSSSARGGILWAPLQSTRQ